MMRTPPHYKAFATTSDNLTACEKRILLWTLGHKPPLFLFTGGILPTSPISQTEKFLQKRIDKLSMLCYYMFGNS